MEGRVYLLGAVLFLGSAWGGCARDRGAPATLPSRTSHTQDRAASARARAAEARERIETELSNLGGESADPGRQGGVQSQIADQQQRIAALTTELQNSQADLAEKRGIVESENSKQVGARQDEMREVAAGLRANESLLAVRERELRADLWPTGETYEDFNVLALESEVETLRRRSLELRSNYAALADENRAAVAESATRQEALVTAGRERQGALAAGVAQAQQSLVSLEQQSKQIETAEARKKQRADELRAELAKLNS